VAPIQATPDAAVDLPSDVALDAAPPVDVGVDRPPPPQPYPRPRYVHLAETGLFADPATRALVPGLLEFQPNHVLWSDGAAKRRWVSLPPGQPIDSDEPDRWRFPIGTKLWKEFSVGGVLVETRLVERYGPGPEDFWMGSFVWNAEQTDAVFAENGQANINGTSHDAPAQKHCWSCHLGEPGRSLGFSAVQLSGDGPGVRLSTLAASGRLTTPPPRTDFRPPGDVPVAAALGYLHANCGHCHNPSGTSWPDTQMNLRLSLADATPEATATYRTTIGKKLQYFRHPTLTERVVAGDPESSALFARLKVRMEKVQMPPLATEVVDPVGVELVQRWIAGLPRP
jgi:hypothetical protein